MTWFKIQHKRLFAGLVAAFLLASLWFTQVAQAATSANFSATITINPGAMNLSHSGSNLSKTITVNGTTQTVDFGALGNITVQDYTGTGDGWRVQVSATQVTENTPTGGFKSGTSAITFPTGSLKIAPPSTITAGTGSSSGSSITKLSTTTAIDGGSAVTVATAPVGQGLGQFTITFPSTNALTLTVPSHLRIVDSVNYPTGGTPYSTTITFSIVKGP